jgi:hypothetical protein
MPGANGELLSRSGVLAEWNLVRVTGLVSALVVLALGCEARVSIGARCSPAQGCSGSLACSAERCREVCIDHRDCPGGNRCLVGTDGLGTCALVDDPACTASSCEPGLTCFDASCFDPCTSGRCPVGGTCVDGRCLSPSTPPVDAGAVDGGAAVDAGAPRRTCSTIDDRESDEVCGGLFGGVPVCRPECRNPGEPSTCATPSSTHRCLYWDPWEDFGCSLGCDPLTSAGCGLDEACDLVGRLHIREAAFDCRRLRRDVFTAGMPCAEQEECAAGHHCVEGVCRQFCTRNPRALAPCPGSLRCEHPYPGAPTILGDDVSFGVCVP